ncbi:MAG TPA: DUF3572 domain-containing protein [Xanthobacteraceae bacterium]|jgi:hypothetical protein
MPIRPRPEYRKSRSDQQHEQVQALAVAAFEFLAADSRRLQRFLDSSGIDLAALRAATGEPDFLAGVLDHLCGEEELLVAFAAENDIAPNRVLAARESLSGRAWERDTP